MITMLRKVAAKGLETELLVERFRGLDILHGQANRECTEFHVSLLQALTTLMLTMGLPTHARTGAATGVGASLRRARL